MSVAMSECPRCGQVSMSDDGLVMVELVVDGESVVEGERCRECAEAIVEASE